MKRELTAPTYALHGLRVRSEVPLCAPVDRNEPPDIEVRWGARLEIPARPPVGRVLAQLSLGDGRGYTHTQTTDGYTLRFDATCEFRISRDCRSIRVHVASDVSPDVVPLLLSGNVLAFLLTIAGECVLHSSAVAWGDRALAVVGGPGMGKSTLAALLCADGAALLSDDLLRVDVDDLRCFPGTDEVRLRQGATSLAKRFPARVSTLTADRRVAIRLDGGSSERPRLSAIVIPRPSRTCAALRLEHLSPTRALFALLRYPRVLGWRATEVIGAQFRALARVAGAVPVCEAELPWGPPFDPQLPAALLDATGLERIVETSA